jgi:hypothetical protein
MKTEEQRVFPQITPSVRPSFPPEARQLTEPAAAEGPVQRRPRRLRAQETAAAHSDHGEDQLWLSCFNQWIGLWENLQETMVFYHHPILCFKRISRFSRELLGEC